MPEMNGFETAKEIRRRFDSFAEEENQGLAIIMMLRSNHLSETIAKAKESGADYYLVKPIRRGELSEVIQSVLNQEFQESLCIGREEWLEIEEASFPMRILLAEDNENNRILFSFYLKSSPHHIEMAENGKICLEKYRSGIYDIVFMDIDMPIMNGYKTTDAIRSWEQRNNRPPVPIIALTGHALRGKAQESLDAGCTEHMTKPFKKKELLKVLRRYSKSLCSFSDGRDSNGITQDDFKALSKSEDTSSPSKPIAYVSSEIKALIPSFFEINHKELKVLEEAICQEDYETIFRMGHKLKGAALCYGFEEVGKLYLQIENAGNEKKPIESIRLILSEILSYLDSVEVVYE
jgi:CheY-like chemotaxis protein/HPt (histidine-containing phosphotransfer) domain-containing protein